MMVTNYSVAQNILKVELRNESLEKVVDSKSTLKFKSGEVASQDQTSILLLTILNTESKIANASKYINHKL